MNSSRNGILDANALCSYVSNHSDPRSSISSSCRSSKCCCSSYDCSYCSPPMSINSEAHPSDDAEDDTNQDSIDTIRDEHKSLITSIDSNHIIRSDSNPRKTSTPLISDEKQSENSYPLTNNVDSSSGSPGCKVHHHHYHHHNPTSSLRTNSALPLRLPLNSSKDGNKKGTNSGSDFVPKSNKYCSVVSDDLKNSMVLQHIKDTNQYGVKENCKAQGTAYKNMK